MRPDHPVRARWAAHVARLLGRYDTYGAEYRFLAGMRQLLPLVTDPTLQAGIRLHITQTRGHIARLQQV